MPDPGELESYLDSTLIARPTIDQAKGVLVGTRCDSPEKAHDELCEVALKHDVELEALAAAVVATAAGDSPEDPLLRKIVWQEWSEILPNCDDPQ